MRKTAKDVIPTFPAAVNINRAEVIMGLLVKAEEEAVAGGDFTEKRVLLIEAVFVDIGAVNAGG